MLASRSSATASAGASGACRPGPARVASHSWRPASGQAVLRTSVSDAACSASAAQRPLSAGFPCKQECAWAPRRAAVRAAAGGAAPAQSDRLKAVLAKIDAMNSQDPRKATVNGQEVPYELAYSQWMTEWVHKLAAQDPGGPTEEVQIAARGQHIARWTSPRSSYPEGKAAYLKWREDLKKFHSSTVAGFMREEGYPEDRVEKVVSIMLKKNLKDPEGQMVEDALCLVFLQQQFAEFRQKESEEKMVDILRKTWRKMGQRGRDAALALPLGPEEAALVGKALAPAS